jgi:hypothetical protein
MTVSSIEPVAGGVGRKFGLPFSDDVRRRVLIALLITMLIPIQPEAGGQRLDPYRLVVLATCIPFFFALLSGRAGRFTWPDALMLGYGFWIIVTIVYHHGMARFAYAAIWGAELIGGYMLGRLLIRSSADYRRFVRYFLIALLVLLPFTLIELLTGRMMITEVLGRFFPATDKFDQVRHGLSRSQVVFPHSILFGLFCSVGAANVYYLYRGSLVRMVPRLVLVVGMTLASLSSGPMLSIGMQTIMAVWDKVTGARWMVLFVVTATMYISLEILSNRGPVILLIETLTFDPSTAWWRVHIWEYGSQNVLANPIMGLGLNDWARPYWLDSTVDNFWLLAGMRHGFPGVGCLVLGIAIHILNILRARGLSDDQQVIRTAYLVGMVGLLFTLSTVHVWDAMAVFVMFLVGAGSFLYTSAPEDGGLQPAEAPDNQTARHRFTSQARAKPAVLANERQPGNAGPARAQVAYSRPRKTTSATDHLTRTDPKNKS